jgi:hypothetical protein
MKKLLFGVLLLMIGLVAWRSIRQPLAVNAAEGDCAINFTVFDIKQYDPSVVDIILFDNKLIANKGEFITIVDKSQLPFTTINAEEALVNKAIDTIINNVCGGKCDENFLAMKSTCVDEISCFINFTAFDPKTYDKENTDNIITNSGLLNKGDFLAQVDRHIFPIKTKTGDKKVIDQTIKDIIINVCKGQCVIGSLSMFPVCSDSSAISSIQTTYLERIANMSLCQKDIFDLMQINNNKYLEIIKKNNSAYYSTMAPITNSFRRDYFATNDRQQRQVILDQYRLQNSQLRKYFYKNQAEALFKFTDDATKLNQSFAECK